MKIKKYLTALFAVCSLFITGCEDETDPGGTAVKKMAGDWWVTVDVIDGETNLGDDYGLGHILMYTYNTAANKMTEMWLEDGGHFWDYKLKVDVQYENRTFSTSGMVDNQAYESQVSITDGKIMEGAATTPSGMPADSIIYYVQFDDDNEGIRYRISGFRRTGFPADDF
ncbi:MAG: hypothetical protein LBL07_19005 [Tannerella sp.]|nr:hypothetical protein [Tannerella sp.]